MFCEPDSLEVATMSCELTCLFPDCPDPSPASAIVLFGKNSMHYPDNDHMVLGIQGFRRGGLTFGPNVDVSSQHAADQAIVSTCTSPLSPF